MDEYTRILNLIKEYLLRLEIDGDLCQNDVISAFELYQIVDDKLNELRSFDDRATKSLQLETKALGLIPVKQKLRVNCYSHAGFSSIHIFYHKYYEFTTIQKDHNDEAIYFEQSSEPKEDVKKFVRDNYENLKQIFNDLERLYDYYQFSDLGTPYSSGNYHRPSILNDLFVLTLSYNAIGDVDMEITIDPSIDQKGIVNRQWVDRENLTDLIETNKVDILKRTPVDITVLDPVTKKIVEDYRANKNKHLVKKIDNQ